MTTEPVLPSEYEVEQLDGQRAREAGAANAAEDFGSLEAAYQSFPHLLFLIGPDDTYVGFRAGRGAVPLAPPESFIGRPVDSVLPDDVAPGILRALTEVRAQGQPVVHEYALNLPAGQRFYEARLVPLEAGVVASLVLDVTERHAREIALRESKDRLRAIVDNEPECVKVVARDGTLIEMNPAGLRMLEAGSLEEARSRPVIAYVAEEHRAAYADLAGRVFGGESDSLSFEIVGLRGTRRWFETSAVPLRNADGTIGAILAITRDITERRAVEMALRRSEERFRALIEQATDVISLHDAQGRFLFMSPSGEAILGWAAEEIRNRDALEFVHPDDLPIAMSALEGLRGGKKDPVRLALRSRTRDGSYRITQIVARNLLHVPAVNAIVANWTDVTEQRRLEEQNQQLQKLEGIGRLAGGIAHDFNNVLTAILGFADLLDAALQDRPEALADLREICRAGERAADLIQQLLAFARRQVLSPRTTQLNEVVKQTRRILHPLVGEDVDVSIILEPDLWLVTVDPSQIEQVLLNLAVNARHAMPNGGKLIIETQNVVLTADHVARHPPSGTGDHVLLAVSDTGAGIPADVLPHVFEPFFTTKPAGVGTGLGLSTVYGIVKQLGGHIWVYSEAGQGTTFKIYFPRATETVVVPVPAPESSPKLAGTETILVVEDEASVRELVARVLKDAGYHVALAATPDEALATAAREESIDLLLTDVVMPSMSGKAVADCLRALRPSLRVLFISGYTEDTIVHHGVIESGVDFLPKPFTPTTLKEHVRAVLDRPSA